MTDQTKKENKIQVIPVTVGKANLQRVIGTLDCRGNGTEHALADVNPFCLLDDAPPITKKNSPPFGLHPHYGLQVVTILLSGRIEYLIGSKPNESHIIGPGPAFSACEARSGVVHDEHTIDDSEAKIFQCVWLVGAKNSTGAPKLVHIQNPMAHQPVQGVTLLVAAGIFQGLDSGIPTPNPLGLAVIYLESGATYTFSVEATHSCFVYCSEAPSSVLLNSTAVSQGQVAVIEIDEKAEKTITLSFGGSTAAATSKARLIVGTGQPITEPWVKMLVGNGFILAPSKDDALLIEKRYQDRGNTGFQIEF